MWNFLYKVCFKGSIKINKNILYGFDINQEICQLAQSHIQNKQKTNKKIVIKNHFRWSELHLMECLNKISLILAKILAFSCKVQMYPLLKTNNLTTNTLVFKHLLLTYD